MIDNYKVKLKSLAAWLYEWATVVAGVVVGGLSAGLDFLDSITGIDLTPLLPPAHAAKIITGVAVAKGIHAFYRSRKAV
jgi:hypothetical protein